MTSSSLSRRTFVRAGATVVAMATALPDVLRAGSAKLGTDVRDDALRRHIHAVADPDFVRAIALTATDAAKAAGATYADVRLTRDVSQRVGNVYAPPGTRYSAEETETHGIGVRAFVNGMWGFAASPYWTVGEAARLAKDAVAQARENAQVTTSRGELVPVPVTTGEWKTPYEVDPFGISLEEKFAFLENAIASPLYRSIELTASGGPWLPLECRRLESTLATTDGTFVRQQYYATRAWAKGDARPTDWIVRGDGARWWRNPNVHSNGVGTDVTLLEGTGWETVRSLPTMTHQLMEEAMRLVNKPPVVASIKPVSLGRYTIVVDATTMSALVGMTLRAMDLDRVLGDEVNATGSSWIGSDPLALLGRFDFGSPLLSVTANRTLPNSPTMTRWDDEGVAVGAFPLIDHGLLHDFATTRDRAAMLAPAYQKLGRPVRTNGCAMSSSAFDQQTLGVPDAVMTPGKDDVGFEQLVASVPRGLAVTDVSSESIQVDMQVRQLVVQGTLREIVNGRLGSRVGPGALLIDAAELWKNLLAIGGRSSLMQWSTPRDSANRVAYSKSQPAQSFAFAVQAVPGIFQNIALIDPTRSV